MIDRTQTWSDYRADESLNGSTLALLLPPDGSPKQLRYRVDSGIGIDPDVVRVGTGIHSIVECLPMNRFSEQYVVMPNFRLDPNNVTGTGKPSESATAWSRQAEEEFRTANDREVLKSSEYKRIARMLKAISENKEALDIIVASDREVSVTAELLGVDCKGRVDGLCGDSLQWNLKTCSGGISKRSFGRIESKLHYTFKDAMHWMLLRECRVKPSEFKYLCVSDEKPIEKGPNAGKFRRAAECVVVDVPIAVFQSMEDDVYHAVEVYKQCKTLNEWPGVQGYSYIPYAPEEVTLVD